jgi:hypothetical protein
VKGWNVTNERVLGILLLLCAQLEIKI